MLRGISNLLLLGRARQFTRSEGSMHVASPLRYEVLLFLSALVEGSLLFRTLWLFLVC